MLTKTDFQQARQMIATSLQPTPLQYSATFSRYTGHQVWVKPENLQKTGSFKFRGAANRMAHLTDAERGQGVITASSGNHGAAVAFAANRQGIPATVVMPEGAPRSKVLAVRGYGADVVFYGHYPDERKEHARALTSEQNLTYVDSNEDEDIIAGQGTCALEILKECPDVDVILAPIGGGGLVSGVAAAAHHLRPDVQVIGVEPCGAASMSASLAAGEPTSVDVETIADGLRSRKPGPMTFAYCQQYVAKIHRVSEAQIADAMVLALERLKLLLEPSGAVALAGLLDGAVTGSDRRVAVVLSGGNVDLTRLMDIMQDHAPVFSRCDMRP